jgi:hypothetical protein
MTEIAPDAYKVDMQLRVAAVGGSFEGEISLSDKQATKTCNIKVCGAGTLGHGHGTARFEIEPDGENGAKLIYKGSGELGPHRGQGQQGDQVRLRCRQVDRLPAVGSLAGDYLSRADEVTLLPAEPSLETTGWSTGLGRRAFSYVLPFAVVAGL